MKVEEAFRTDLLTIASLTALVSSRVYPIDATIQGSQTYPYIVYFPLSDRIGRTAENQSYEMLLQLSIHSKTFTQASAIADIIRDWYAQKKHIVNTGIVIYSIIYDGKGRAQIDNENGFYLQPLTFRVSYLYT